MCDCRCLIFQRLHYSKVPTDPKQHTARKTDGWRRVSGDLWQKVKGKVYEMTVRPAMMYGLEMVAVSSERQEAEVSLRAETIRNEDISKTKLERQG